MSVGKIVFVILMLSNSVFGAVTATTPFKSWDNCPETKAATLKKIDDLKNVGEQFVDLSDKEKDGILDAGGWQAIYLRHIAAFLMAENLDAAFAKSCWAHFESMHRSMKSNDWDSVKIHNEVWNACLVTTYKEVPNELKAISDCVQSVSRHK